MDTQGFHFNRFDSPYTGGDITIDKMFQMDKAEWREDDVSNDTGHSIRRGVLYSIDFLFYV